MKAKAKTLEERTGKDRLPEKSSIFHTDEIDILAFGQEELNPEINLKTLLILKSNFLASDDSEEILRKTLQAYPDCSLADDALDYLEKISEDTLIARVREARDTLNKNFGREIVAGKNISKEARDFSQLDLGSPTALRDLYREITGTERSANQLFEDLSTKFPFEKLKEVIKFLLNALGRDIKSKGPSIEKPLLYKLLTETRNLQAILSLYLFFKQRMGIIFRGFDKNGLYYPKKLTFDLMARLFMKLLEDKYPSAVKVIRLSRDLGIEEEIIAQIIVLSQFRDAVRNVAPKLYRSNQHRQELLNAYMDALEELEDSLEEPNTEEEKS